MTVQEKATLTLYTAADLAALPDDGTRYELDRGNLIVMPPPKREHGLVANRIAYLLTGFIETHDLGVVIAEIGYQLAEKPDTVRAPDVSFVAKARVTPSTGDDDRFAPDLAVEIASPGNTTSDMNQKIEQFFAAGARQVWVLYPRTRTIYRYTSARKVTILGIEDMLEGGDVLPGFAVSVQAIFSVLDALSDTANEPRQ